MILLEVLNSKIIFNFFSRLKIQVFLLLWCYDLLVTITGIIIFNVLNKLRRVTFYFGYTDTDILISIISLLFYFIFKNKSIYEIFLFYTYFMSSISVKCQFNKL